MFFATENTGEGLYGRARVRGYLDGPLGRLMRSLKSILGKHPDERVGSVVSALGIEAIPRFPIR